jgi:hypothetical protein
LPNSRITRKRQVGREFFVGRPPKFLFADDPPETAANAHTLQVFPIPFHCLWADGDRTLLLQRPPATDNFASFISSSRLFHQQFTMFA